VSVSAQLPSILSVFASRLPSWMAENLDGFEFELS
jgi:hypothetical protein